MNSQLKKGIINALKKVYSTKTGLKKTNVVIMNHSAFIDCYVTVITEFKVETVEISFRKRSVDPKGWTLYCVKGEVNCHQWVELDSIMRNLEL